MFAETASIRLGEGGVKGRDDIGRRVAYTMWNGRVFRAPQWCRSGAVGQDTRRPFLTWAGGSIAVSGCPTHPAVGDARCRSVSRAFCDTARRSRSRADRRLCARSGRPRQGCSGVRAPPSHIPFPKTRGDRMPAAGTSRQTAMSENLACTTTPSDARLGNDTSGRPALRARCRHPS